MESPHANARESGSDTTVARRLALLDAVTDALIEESAAYLLRTAWRLSGGGPLERPVATDRREHWICVLGLAMSPRGIENDRGKSVSLVNAAQRSLHFITDRL